MVIKKFCLNLSALMHLDLEEQLKAAARAGFSAVGLREVNLLYYLSTGKTVDDARKLLDSYGLISVEYDFFSDWIYTEDSDRTGMCEKFENFCETGASLYEKTLLITPVSYQEKNAVTDFDLSVKNLKALGEIARTMGTAVAVEFLPWTKVDSLGKAWKLVKEVGADNVGIVLDTFHYFEGPSTREELQEVPLEKIFLCHLNDMRSKTGDLITRTREQRVLPGEGFYPLDEVVSDLKARGYSGYYSLEILNSTYKDLDPMMIARDSYASLENLLLNYQE